MSSSARGVVMASDAIGSDSSLNMTHAHRAWVATDTASYYRAFVDAARQARHSLFIVGWDLDTRVDLLREDEPLRLIDFLTDLAEANPELQVRVLCWGGAFIYRLEREAWKSLKFSLRAPDNLRFEYDETDHQDISKHQKIVVVDDVLAFCGGIDLTRNRWDESDHEPDNPDRVDPSGDEYDPFHDVQMAVDDESARALGTIARRRWAAVTEEEIPFADNPSPIWPPVEPDLTDIDIAICRTEPGENGGAITEIEDRYVEMLSSARERIYLETQYLTARRIREVLQRRLGEPDGPEVVIVTPRATDGMAEQATMNVLRWEILDSLRADDAYGRMRVVFPSVRDEEATADVYVHAKVCIVDDEWLHVGSANLTTRSLQLDYECDLSVRAKRPETRVGIRRIRARLLGAHLGRETDEVVEIESLRALIDDQPRDAERRLERLDDQARTRSLGFEDYADRASPLEATDVAEDLFEGEAIAFPYKKIGAFLGITIALAAAWRFTPLGEYADPQALADWFSPFRHSPWGPPLAMLGFAVLASIGVPATILVLACGLALGTWFGWLCALVGATASAWLTFEMGRKLGSDTLNRLPMPARARSIYARVRERGFLAVVALRIVPVAPFVVINLVTGASEIRRRDFLVATVVTMTPGTFVMVYYGAQLAEFIGGASFWVLVGVAAIAACVIALAWWIERAIDRPRGVAPEGPEL